MLDWMQHDDCSHATMCVLMVTLLSICRFTSSNGKVGVCNATKEKTDVATVTAAVSLPRPSPEATMMQAIAAGPVAIAISVSGGFRGARCAQSPVIDQTTSHLTLLPLACAVCLWACVGYKSGVLKAPGCTDFKIDHSVTLVGYDTSLAAQALSNSTGYW